MAKDDKKDKLTAALLAWFLGAFGGHRFYLGQMGAGLAHLLFSLTFFGLFITGPIAFFDAIGLLIMSQETFDRKYNPHLYIPHDNRGYLPLNVNVADEIEKLDELFKKGVITFEEFERRKSRLLS